MWITGSPNVGSLIYKSLGKSFFLFAWLSKLGKKVFTSNIYIYIFLYYYIFFQRRKPSLTFSSYLMSVNFSVERILTVLCIRFFLKKMFLLSKNEVVIGVEGMVLIFGRVSRYCSWAVYLKDYNTTIQIPCKKGSLSVFGG